MKERKSRKRQSKKKGKKIPRRNMRKKKVPGINFTSVREGSFIVMAPKEDPAALSFGPIGPNNVRLGSWEGRAH